MGDYAIGPDVYCWQVACLVGMEELVWTALAYIEVLEEDNCHDTNNDLRKRG
jgi:hypothetical protein